MRRTNDSMMLMMLLLLLPIKRCPFLRMSCQRTFSNDRVTERGARRLLVVGWCGSQLLSRDFMAFCALFYLTENSILPPRAAKICGQFTDLAATKKHGNDGDDISGRMNLHFDPFCISQPNLRWRNWLLFGSCR